jgi:hypothetical protein
MAEYEFQALLSAIHEQLNRNGLAEDSLWNQQPAPKLDIDEIRLTIEREEKLYLRAVNE